jgi:VWFA-related protein
VKIGIAILVGLLWVALVGAQLNAQTPEHNGQRAAPVIRVSSELVVLDVLVENKKTGAPIGYLEAKDFEVTEDGAPQQISYFSRDQLPLSVVFLFDLTETVQPILKPLSEGAFEILGHLKPQDQVAIMVFSSHTELLQDFTTDRQLASVAVRKASEMSSGEGTFIHEDMYEAVEQGLKSTPPETRRVLVWLTDGTANLENSFTQKTIGKEAPARLHTKEESTTKLMQSGVVVAALIDRSAATDAFIAAADASPLLFLVGARTGDISHYADMTGGPVLKTSKKEVAARLAELIDELRARYTLGYVPVGSKAPGTFCKLRVTLAKGAYRGSGLRKSEVTVRSRSGYYRESSRAGPQNDPLRGELRAARVQE